MVYMGRARMRPSVCRQRGSRRRGPTSAGRPLRPVPSAARVVDGPRSRAAGAARPAAQLVRRSAGDIASAACAGGFEATVPRRAGRGWPLLSVSVAQHVASRRRPASLQALAHELTSRQAPHRDVRACLVRSHDDSGVASACPSVHLVCLSRLSRVITAVARSDKAPTRARVRRTDERAPVSAPKACDACQHN